MSKDSKVSNQLGNVTSIDPTKTKAVFDSRYSSYEIIIGKDDTSTINEPITYNSLVVFSDPVSISVKSNDNKLVFNNKVIIKNIVFEKEVTFEDIIFEHEVLFENITFNMKVTFKKVVFKKGVDFKSTIFKNADFDFVVFNGEADFKKATFNNDISFKYTTFKERGAFAEITLIENISFECLVLNDKSHIYFRNTTEKIDTGLYKNKKISIRDTVINGRIDFNNNKIGIIDLRGSVVIGSGTINMIDFNPKCENHQTATVLKNEAIKRNDIIKALEYKAEEKNLYAKALKHHAKEKIKSIFKKTNQLADKNTSNFKGVQWISEILSILLSRVSNNHGQNWGQALIVTFFVGLIFFLLFYLVYILLACQLILKKLLHRLTFLCLYTLKISSIYFQILQ